MGRVRALDRRRNFGAREALIAATMIHLSAGDLVSGGASDATLQAVAPKSAAAHEAHELPANLRLPLCAGAARGMKTAGTDRIAACFVAAGAAEPGWADALKWAHRDELPLLVIVADDGARTAHRRAGANSRSAPMLVWPELTKLGRGMHLPHFPVDGEDAVAVYRVVQETSARARSGGGPSVIWAMLTAGRVTPRQQPLKRLEQYMSARGIRL